MHIHVVWLLSLSLERRRIALQRPGPVHDYRVDGRAGLHQPRALDDKQHDRVLAVAGAEVVEREVLGDQRFFEDGATAPPRARTGRVSL